MLNYKGDPYSTENIMIHEFAHAILSMGLRTVAPTFQPRLSKVYEAAKAKGLWKKTYAISNISEYGPKAPVVVRHQSPERLLA